MTDRDLPDEQGVVRERPEQGGGAATPSFAIPADADTGIPGRPRPVVIGPQTFTWGARTWVMGILNVTPDSFSGDGLMAAERAADPVGHALAQARAMVADGADLLDVGGASSRPGHAGIPPEEEVARVVPVIRAVAEALPGIVISIDTTSPTVAVAALDAGAHLLNDIWGVSEDPSMLRVAAERNAPIVVMHNRAEARYRNVLAEVISDLQRTIDRALDIGVAWDNLIVDPGFGFGKAPDHNIEVMARLADLRILARPILLGTSRKSTLGKILDLPPSERVEATTTTTALGIAAGADIVRVHDVRANVRTARVTDAMLRGWRPTGWPGT